LKQAYATVGLSSDRSGTDLGFVDIGHSGTMQAAIADVLSLNGTTGYYFSTFQTVQQTLAKRDSRYESYFGSLLRPGDKDHPYMKHILMYETTFLNDKDSFLCYRSGQPVFRVEDDFQRKSLSREMHSGAERFCRDLATTLPEVASNLRLKSSEVVSIFEKFLEAPTAEDARVFQGIPFENAYSGRATRWIVPPVPDAAGVGIWREGVSVLKTGGLPARAMRKVVLDGERADFTHRLITALGELLVPAGKREKFRKSRRRFFEDSQSKILRMVGAAFYGDPRAR
jgi:hypothetical protein